MVNFRKSEVMAMFVVEFVLRRGAGLIELVENA